MSKLTLVLLAVILTFTISSLAGSLGDADSQLERKDDVDDMETDDQIGRSATSNAQARATASNQGLPVVYQRLVNCYVCTDCPQVHANMTTKMCPGSYDRNKHNKCVVYSERYKHMKKPWYIRGCASERGSCKDIRKAHEAHENIVSLVSCVECEGDKCNVNGVSRSIPNFVTSFLVLVVTPVLGKYTVS